MVDGVDQTDLVGQGMKGAQAAVASGTGPVTDLVMDVASGKDGLGAITQFSFVEAPVDAALAVGKFLMYLGIHSKPSTLKVL
jgi:hypothetical protein